MVEYAKRQDITEALCGTRFTESVVSSLVGTVNGKLSTYRTWWLNDVIYPYLSVVARYEDVRPDGRVMNQGVLIVCGVWKAGNRSFRRAVRAVSDRRLLSKFHRPASLATASYVRGDDADSSRASAIHLDVLQNFLNLSARLVER